MLFRHARGPKSSEVLARAAGWGDYGAANLHYGTIAKEVGRWLGLSLARFDRDGTEFFTSAIAQERRAESWVYELHAEFLEALRRHGIV